MLLVSGICYSQDLEITLTNDSDNVVMRITNKDTIVYDSMGTIRFLLKYYDLLLGDLRRTEIRLQRAEETMQTIDGIMFWQPRRPKYFKL
jgi:hypothetical protein